MTDFRVLLSVHEEFWCPPPRTEVSAHEDYWVSADTEPRGSFAELFTKETWAAAGGLRKLAAGGDLAEVL